MTTEQPEVLRIADALQDGTYLLSVERDATAAELRRLHAIEAEHVKLCGDYQDTWSSRDRLHAENQQLRAEMEAIGAGGVGPLMKSAHREQHFDMVPLPRQQVDLIIQELARYCNTGEMDDAESLLASLQFSLDPNQQPPTTERFLAVEQPQDEQRPVAYEFYNPATGHAIVDYSEHTHVGHLSADKGYIANPLVHRQSQEPVEISHSIEIECQKCEATEQGVLMVSTHAQPPRQPQGEQERCHLCDCTGDIHGLDGEWRGECPYCRPQPPVVEQVPVAWVKPNWQADPWAHAVMDAQKKRDMAKSSADSMHRFSAAHTVPLYTHPQREPLTLEQIAVAFGWKKGCLPLPRELQATRAIERAHGIGCEA